MKRYFEAALVFTLSCGSAAWADVNSPATTSGSNGRSIQAANRSGAPTQQAPSQASNHPVAISHTQWAPNVAAALSGQAQASHQQTHAAASSNPVSRGNSGHGVSSSNPSNSSASHQPTHSTAQSNSVSHAASVARSYGSVQQSYSSSPTHKGSYGNPASGSSDTNYSGGSSTANDTGSYSYYGVKTDGERKGHRNERKYAGKKHWRDRRTALDGPVTQNVEVLQTYFKPTKVVTWDEEADGVETYVSLDGTRAVKIDENTRDAYLCDRSESPAFQPVFLASNVKSAKFSDGDLEGSLQVMLTLQDGSFGLFDAMGSAYQVYASSETANVESIDEMSQR